MNSSLQPYVLATHPSPLDSMAEQLASPLRKQRLGHLSAQRFGLIAIRSGLGTQQLAAGRIAYKAA